MSEIFIGENKLKSILACRMHLQNLLLEADCALQQLVTFTDKHNNFKGFGTKTSIELAKTLIKQSLNQLEDDL